MPRRTGPRATVVLLKKGDEKEIRSNMFKSIATELSLTPVSPLIKKGEKYLVRRGGRTNTYTLNKTVTVNNRERRRSISIPTDSECGIPDFIEFINNTLESSVRDEYDSFTTPQGITYGFADLGQDIPGNTADNQADSDVVTPQLPDSGGN